MPWRDAGRPMRAVAVTVFWISAILIAFAYAGYPLLIHGLSRIRRRTHARRDVLPRISLVVPAYNEARVIEAKIANCVALDYPRDRLEVLVASDGSTDGTAEHLNRAANAGLIRSFIYAERRGKASVLNDLVGSASGDVIVFSDATSMLAPESLRALASNFADAHVGCVSGVYRVVRARGGRITLEPESAYWRYETFIRQSESDLGTMLGAHGSMYAIRRDLYERLDSRVINDDFVIPLTILLKGFKCIYEPRAIASEEGSEMEGFSRRIRIMTGNVQQLFLLLQRPMWSGRPLLLFQLLSHKALRLLIPFLLVSVYVSNVILLESVGYRVAFAAQTVFLAAALAGVSARMRVIGRAFIAAPYYVCMLNAAALLGLYRTLGQGGTVAWKAE